MQKVITTIAAKCPQCNSYHLIGCMNLFLKSREQRERYEELVDLDFTLHYVTTDEAISNFGICDNFSNNE